MLENHSDNYTVCELFMTSVIVRHFATLLNENLVQYIQIIRDITHAIIIFFYYCFLYCR